MAQLVITGDGSHTLFMPGLNEHYHSTFGALTESKHVFIRNGIDLFSGRKELTIFETGFGTGLNALLTALNAIDRGIVVKYYAIEKYPVDHQIIRELNYPYLLETPGNRAGKLFEDIHKAAWNCMTEVHLNFHLKKIQGDLCYYFPDFNYDLIYFDAFAPDKLPEMWTGDILHRLVRQLNEGGIFTTYCVKGSVKRVLKECGLSVEKIPGPPGKREILRGTRDKGQGTRDEGQGTRD